MWKVVLTVLGVLCLIAAIGIGLWVGLGWGIYGGICQIIDGATAEPVVGADIGWGIVRILLAGPAAAMAAIGPLIVGYSCTLFAHPKD